MSLLSPNLDDRTFDQLVKDAKLRANQSCPAWTDWTEGDPGVVLLELFAYLTETMLYRLNRLPEKAYVEFLRLMGVRLHPPHAAEVMLRFTRTKSASGAAAGGERKVIPRGTRVTLARSGGGKDDGAAPVFVTTAAATLEAGQESIDLKAIAFEPVDAELAGTGTGLGGQSVRAARPPIIAPAGDEPSLEVGVELGAGEGPGARTRRLESNGKAYRIWREVENFADLGNDRFAYIVDRVSGTIAFAPSAELYEEGTAAPAARQTPLGEAPGAGREVRLWYRRGGGPRGNVAAGVLTVMKDPIAGIDVTNPGRATGGSDAESVSNALVRGPQTMHSLKRAVTARDYQQLAENSGEVARARAFARAKLWVHAAAGAVQVLLVPNTDQSGKLTAEALRAYHVPDARDRIQAMLEERSPLGTTVLVTWVDYKVVSVKARVIFFRGEDADDVKARVTRRLDQFINPLPTPIQPGGWPFGQPLQVGRVYDAIFAEAGVKDVDNLRLRVSDVPDQTVRSVAADAFQPATWHVVSGDALYRSTDNGQGWERLRDLPEREAGEEVRRVRSHRARAGWLAAVTFKPGDGGGGRVYVSDDCGDTWRRALRAAFEVHDVAWALRDAAPALLVASDKGLYELAIDPGAAPQQLIVGDLPKDLGFWTVTVAADVRGRSTYVAVAAKQEKGVWISHEGGQSKTYIKIGLEQKDVRVLTVQNDGSHSNLWAGVTVFGGMPGDGAWRWVGLNDGWKQFIKGWLGASCYSITASASRVWAATYNAGVLTLNTMQPDPVWQATGLGCGLPFANNVLLPIRGIATDPEGQLVLAGTDGGMYKSGDGGATFVPSSRREFDDAVSLPQTALFVPGEHEIQMVQE